MENNDQLVEKCARCGYQHPTNMDMLAPDLRMFYNPELCENCVTPEDKTCFERMQDQLDKFNEEPEAIELMQVLKEGKLITDFERLELRADRRTITATGKHEIIITATVNDKRFTKTYPL